MKKLPKTKVCSNCKRRKPRSREYFEVNNRPHSGGLSAHCRVCRRAYYRCHFKKMYKDPAWRQKKIAIVTKAMIKYRKNHVDG